MVKAVEANTTDQRWVVLYVKRWLKAPLQHARWHPGRAGPRDPAGFGGHAPNAMGNFCFDVTLSYRRLELPRRAKAGF